MTTSPFAYVPRSEGEARSRVAAQFEAVATGPRRQRDLRLWLLTQLDRHGPDAWSSVTDYYAGSPSPAVRATTRRAISELLRDGAIEVETVYGERLGWRSYALTHEDSLLLRIRLTPVDPQATDGQNGAPPISAFDATWDNAFLHQDRAGVTRSHGRNETNVAKQVRLTDPVALVGERVRLEPLGPNHIASLESNLQHGELWTNPYTFVPHPRDLDGFLTDALQAQEAGRELAYATVDISTGEVVGSTRYRSVDHDHRRAEIGFTFVAPRWQRTYVNTEAKFLMLSNAFDTHGYMRVEMVTDARNEQSRAAIARLGATLDGVLRHHMLLRDGNPRDSALYSIIAPDWEDTVRPRLEARLATPQDAGEDSSEGPEPT